MRFVALLIAAATLHAADLMPHAQQTQLVMKYCAVCHSDTSRNGGLTLQHFDASKLDPSLAAMLVSKLRGGAMGASGIPTPDRETTKALTAALAAESEGAQQWTVSKQSAAILREVPTPSNAGNQPNLYRLVVSCDPATGQGEVQLTWAPNAATGTVLASLDGKAPTSHIVEGTEPMGNGQGSALRASVKLASTMPEQSLTVSNIFPDQKVSFPFESLPGAARQALAACFPSK